MGEVIEVRPNRGPQERFLSSPADIAIYGGAAGAGKSYALALEALRHIHRKGVGVVIFRRELTRLTGAGSIWETTESLYPSLGLTSRQSPVMEWRHPKSGSTIELRHLQHESDKHAHQGKQYTAILFDEITEFSESQFWYLLSRARTTSGVHPYMRGTCNPDPDSFVRRLIDWWIGPDGLPIHERSGVLRWMIRHGDDVEWFDSKSEAQAAHPGRMPLSFTFVAARLSDNPKGDPTYEDKLRLLPRVERERLLGGNWNVRPAAGMYFKRHMFEILDRRPYPDQVVRRVRAWDKAATAPSPTNPDPDWTVGVLVSELQSGGWVIEHVERLRGAPAEVERVIRGTAQSDGIETEVYAWQDPGQAGVVDVDRMRHVLQGFQFSAIRASKDKITYAGVWQSQAEGRRISIVRGPWLESLLSTLESFPEGKHDDDVDACSLAFQAYFGSAMVDTLLAAYDTRL